MKQILCFTFETGGVLKSRKNNIYDRFYSALYHWKSIVKLQCFKLNFVFYLINKVKLY